MKFESIVQREPLEMCNPAPSIVRRELFVSVEDVMAVDIDIYNEQKKEGGAQIFFKNGQSMRVSIEIGRQISIELEKRITDENKLKQLFREQHMAAMSGQEPK